MSDLISRGALVEKLIKRFKDIDRGRVWRNEHMPIHDGIRLDEIENLQSIALDIEPVDAVPVVHARLKETGWDEAWCQWGDCTKCGHSNIIGSKYCNKCGAKLDEDKTEE